MDNLLDTEKIIDYKQFKWLVSSCLQKSLRRGRFDLAQEYVKFLWEHDRNYITYRFGTILAEDVGIANLPLVKEYLDTKLAKKKIDEKGGLDFFLNLTKLACDSVKDRSSCDSAYISHYYSLDQDNTSFADIFNQQDRHYIDKINASWSILGNQKFKHEQLHFNINEVEAGKDNLETYLSLILSSTNQEITDIVHNAYYTQIENIFLGIPVIWNAYQYELQHDLPESKFKVGQVIEHTYIKETTFHHPGSNLELISCGVDGHTREGKTAYYQFLKTKNSFSDYLYSKGIPQEQHMIIFSHCMFRVEGHEVNKRLYFPTALHVMRDCESDILHFKVGLPPNTLDFNVLKKSIIAEIDNINILRNKNIVNAVIPMIDKPQPKEKKQKKSKIT